LSILDAEDAEGRPHLDFRRPWLTRSAGLRYDLDMTSTSLVNT